MEKIEELIQETLAELLKNMGIPFRRFTVEAMEQKAEGHDTVYRVDVDTSDSALLIGYHGENAYALQHILKTILYKKTNQNIFVVVDVDGYRKRQEDSVITLAHKKVEVLRKTGQRQILPPMSPFFRRIVHLALTGGDFTDVVTESTGEGDSRAVTLSLKN